MQRNIKSVNKNTVLLTERVVLLTKTICNRCGKIFDIWDTAEQFKIHKQCGYGTKFDGDGLVLNICCSCLEELVEGCVISPIKHNVL